MSNENENLLPQEEQKTERKKSLEKIGSEIISEVIDNQVVEVIQQEKTDFAEWASGNEWFFAGGSKWYNNNTKAGKSSPELYSDFIEWKSKQLKP